MDFISQGAPHRLFTAPRIPLYRCGAHNYPVMTKNFLRLQQHCYNIAITVCIRCYPCDNIVAAEEGDDCHSISKNYDVSSFSLLCRNNLEACCTNFLVPVRFCLPETCNIYTVQGKDTYYDIVKVFGYSFSVTQLISWNANINRACGNLEQLVGSQICIRFVRKQNLQTDSNLINSMQCTRRICQPPIDRRCI